MQAVFVHGWGFHAGLWSEVLPLLDGFEPHPIDLGFISGGPCGVKDWPPEAIAIGHSLGLLWLLKQAPGRFRAAVSVSGFDCFCCHIPSARVTAMKRSLLRDPASMLASFWQACGTEAFAPAEALRKDRLAAGLDWLMQWDARGALSALDCPVLGLAARDDLIVPPEMSEAVWGERLVWSESGGHALPLTKPEWCAQEIRKFADGLRA